MGGEMTPERLAQIKAYPAFADIRPLIAEIERLEQELSLEKANAEMRRKEILLGVKEIVRLQGLVQCPTNKCECGNIINHDYCTQCLRQWES